MSNTVKHLLGKQTSAEKRAARQQTEALNAQRRAANAALEDGAIVRAEQAASGRRLRGLGRRALAYMGSELGVAGSLAGG